MKRKNSRSKTNMQAVLQDAIAWHQAGELDKAESHYKKLLKTQPNHLTVLTNLATIALQKGRTEEGIRLLRKSLKQDPNQPYTLNNLGYALKNSSQPEQALDYFNRAISLDPNYADAYCNRGNTYQDLEQFEAALADFDQAIALKPDYADAYSNRGIVLQSLERLDDALSNYDKALTINPQLAEAHLNRGNTLKDLKRFDEALQSYDHAIAINPRLFKAYLNKGNVFKELNAIDQALENYDQAIVIAPEDAEPYINKGFILQTQKKLDEALSYYEKSLALQADNAIAYLNRGNVLKDLDRLDEALDSYSQAIKINPDYAQAYSNRGVVLQKLERLDEALADYDQAISIDSDFSEVHYNRGSTLEALDRLEEALNSYGQALAIDPECAEAYFNKGHTLQKAKRMEEALACYYQAIAYNPQFEEAHINRGTILEHLGQLEEALDCYKKVIEISPDRVEALSNLGNIYQYLKQFKPAFECFDKAISLDPDNAIAHWNKSFAKLINGEFEEGWQLYEWRWKTKQFDLHHQDLTQPLWLGQQSLKNKYLFIYPEQGYGDFIQCIRYAQLAEAAGATVIIEVPKALMSLTTTLKGKFTLIEAGQTLPDFDYHCPVMSLPLAFKTTLETIPADIPYFFADPEKQAIWQQRLGEKKSFRIGLVWSGSTAHTNDRNRSLPIIQLAPLFTLPAEFYALQKEIRPEDASFLAKNKTIKNYQDDLLDFSDTAALIAEMDLVISVDTSVAHLAGALGKPLWLLLAFSQDYRWLLNRNDSPWYPTATLFRQPKLGDWDQLITQIKTQLEITIDSPLSSGTVVSHIPLAKKEKTVKHPETALKPLSLSYTQTMQNINRPAPFVLISSNHGTLIINRNDYRLINDNQGYGVGYQIMSNSSFDPDEVNLVLGLLQLRKKNYGSGVIAIDCGANIGVHTVEWGRLMYDWGYVYSFEAQERVFYALAGNIAINNCLNVSAKLAAVGSSLDEMEIPEPNYLVPSSFGSFELKQKANTEFIGQTIDYAHPTKKVPQVTLDSMGLQRVDLIKIDVEGMEEEVLQGAKGLINQFHPIMLIESIKSDTAALNAFLEQTGYTIFSIGINLLAVHKDDSSLQSIIIQNNVLSLNLQ